MSKLTPDQDKALRGLLKLIETTHTLVSNGLFPGIAAQNITEVLVWLSKYHKDVKYQLPVAEEKPTVKVTTPEESVTAEAVVVEKAEEAKVGE